jgi:hypothetical protein
MDLMPPAKRQERTRTGSVVIPIAASENNAPYNCRRRPTVRQINDTCMSRIAPSEDVMLAPKEGMQK